MPYPYSEEFECYFYKGIRIPGCMGYAVYQKHSACTCGITLKELAKMKRKSKESKTAEIFQHNHKSNTRLMGTNSLNIEIKKSPDEAPDYNEIKPRHLPASLDKAVVVKNGTAEGRSTVDLIFTDEKGNKHVAMITGRLLTTLVKTIGEE